MAIISLSGSTTGSAINGGAITMNLPAARSSGDYVIVSLVSGIALGATPTLSVTSSSGAAYTQIVATISSSQCRFGVFRSILPSTTQTQCIAQGSTAAAAANAAGLMLFHFVDNSTSEDVTATSTTGLGTTPDSPSITVASCGCAIVSAVGTSVISTLVAPSSFLDALTKSTNDTNDSAIGMAWITNTTTAAFNPGAWTSTASRGWCSATIALRPGTYNWGRTALDNTAQSVVYEKRRVTVRSY